MAVSIPSIPPPSSVFSAYASISAFFFLLKTIINQFFPSWLQEYVRSLILRWFSPTSPTAAVVIDRWDGMSRNEVYDAAEIYLCAKNRLNVGRLKVSKRSADSEISVKFARSEKMGDFFEGVSVEWEYFKEESKGGARSMDEDADGSSPHSCNHFFELSFDRAHKQKIIDSYIPFVMERAKLITEGKRLIKIHSLSCSCSIGANGAWDSTNLDHPSTFTTLAMDPILKKFIIDDLDRFVGRKELYKKVGKAWKRGYLLYGPPGTGKSSLIAAIANYLKFDIYDLELGSVRRDSDLRKVLLRTANRSILVIEDIDCSIDLPERNLAPFDDRNVGAPRRRENQFTLSGLLNFIDGLWSSCGQERIIIFTTNDKGKLDAALLRPGRMDVHIHMSYLTVAGMITLAENYLDGCSLADHPRFSHVEELIKRVNVTPAEVAEELIKSDDPDYAIDELICFLKGREKAIMDGPDVEGVE